MDKKTKIFWIILALLLIGSVAFTYYRIIIKRDYMVFSQIDCDPYEERCFIWECDPDSTEEGEACTGDPEMNIWYYKLVNRKANEIQLCDPNVDENCDPWTCESDEEDCGETLCDEETKAEQEAECSNPEVYALENPIEEEEMECEEGDEECLTAEEETDGDNEEIGSEEIEGEEAEIENEVE